MNDRKAGRSGARRWLRWGLPILVLIALGVLARPGDERPGEGDAALPVLRLERDGLLYTYHVITGTEALHDLRADPERRTNLLTVRREDAIRLRRELERRLGVDSLDHLRDENDPRIRELRSLGYL